MSVFIYVLWFWYYLIYCKYNDCFFLCPLHLILTRFEMRGSGGVWEQISLTCNAYCSVKKILCVCLLACVRVCVCVFYKGCESHRMCCLTWLSVCVCDHCSVHGLQDHDISSVLNETHTHMNKITSFRFFKVFGVRSGKMFDCFIPKEHNTLDPSDRSVYMCVYQARVQIWEERWAMWFSRWAEAEEST